MKRIHLVAIGGSAMHNMALSLHEKGFVITGSDDEINEPSKSRLKAAGLLPETIGWFPEKINPSLDAIIVGMHARVDNPELIRAKELGIKVFSYPEYIYEATKDKTRIVIGGSHGKTTITAMILHVLKACGQNPDYMVGAQLAGFQTMVKLTNEASIAVIEGDEYLASPLDRRPKFHLYHPHIAIISGIAWDHINVFPTFENYVEQFKLFIELIEENGSLIYCEEDAVLKNLVETFESKKNLNKIPYKAIQNKITDGTTTVIHNGIAYPLSIFGDHNLMNLNAARLACNQIKIDDKTFLKAIQSFTGAAKRLELVYKCDGFNFYKDFAHSPSKLKATTSSVKNQFPNRKLIACMELHTFSSLNEAFLNEYDGAMALADEAIVYFNLHTIEHKKLNYISPAQVKNAFNQPNLNVFTSTEELTHYLKSITYNNHVLLMMSSGNFDGVDFSEFAHQLNTK